ncbi:MAG: hypothetical protein WCP52_04940 [Bacteroidota bacterium]
MKSTFTVSVIALYMLTSCNSPKGATSSTYNDDVYYTAKDDAAEKEKRQLMAENAKLKAENDRKTAELENLQNKNNSNQSSSTSSPDDYYQSPSHSNTSSDNQGTTTINNYYDKPFNYDDYYDDEYAARLRRFHSPVGNYGYYDDYYTNSYWYNPNPYYYGSSIYMGYNFWGPSYNMYAYNPGFNMYSNMGWGYDPYYNPYGMYSNMGMGYNPYSYGYNPYGYGYNPYMSGYYNGYNSGYYANNYFNSYDNNSYYGPRKTTGGNGRRTAQPSLGHRYMETVEAETNKPFAETKGRTNNPYLKTTTVEDYMTTRPAVHNTNTNYERPTGTNNRPTESIGRDNVKPTNNNTSRPTEHNEDYYRKPPLRNNGNQNIDNNKPRNNDEPRYEQPRNEQQHNEQSKPSNDRPREPPKPTYSEPRISQPTPRSSGANEGIRSSSPSNSGGGSRGNSSSPASGGRKR